MGPAISHVTYASIASFDNGTKKFAIQSSYIVVPIKKGDDPKMNCPANIPEPVIPILPKPTPPTLPGITPQGTPSTKPGKT